MKEAKRRERERAKLLTDKQTRPCSRRVRAAPHVLHCPATRSIYPAAPPDRSPLPPSPHQLTASQHASMPTTTAQDGWATAAVVYMEKRKEWECG